MADIGSNARPKWPLAVVVGAGGMGMAVARRLGQDHRLLLVDQDEAHLGRVLEQMKAEGLDVSVLRCDVADFGHAHRPAKECESPARHPAVISLKVNGGARAEVMAGLPVRLSGTIVVPSRAVTVVAADWDFDSSGAFAQSSPVPRQAARATVSVTHVFDRPGTYSVTLRGSSHREGHGPATYGRIQNLSRVRVIVR